MRFLFLLQQKVDALLAEGRQVSAAAWQVPLRVWYPTWPDVTSVLEQVIVTGDLNIAASQLDVHANADFSRM